MKPPNRLVEFANSSFGFWTCFLGGLGGRGELMTTLLRKHLEQYLRKSRFTRRHQTYFWTLRTRPWDFGGLSAKTRNWLGGSFCGDDHDTGVPIGVGVLGVGVE